MRHQQLRLHIKAELMEQLKSLEMEAVFQPTVGLTFIIISLAYFLTKGFLLKKSSHKIPSSK